ncbi:MAG TPA: ATP-binding protein [Candidatus Deferrimicrobium sp.]|nr:ATP-binding protein [Candidatus Deferrimicrobium sp.]
MKKITVVSGKGGVGKTTLTASLAILFFREKFSLVLTDCDVDAPNLSLILKNQEFERHDIFSANIAIVNKSECISCKKCREHCKFDAISWNDEENMPFINEFACEGCGACTIICPANCIQLTPVKTGALIISESQYGFPLISGELLIGRGNSGKIVAEAKMKALSIAEQNKSEIILNDGPPGIGCPVIASLSDSDFIILITEPMPAAIHDLKRVLSLAWHFTNEIGLIINKYDLYPPLITEIENFAKDNNVYMIGRIPTDNQIPESLVHSTPVVEYSPDSPASKAIHELFENLISYLKIKKE